MRPEDARSLVELFFEQADRRADKPFVWSKVDGTYRSQSWREVAEQVARLAGGLKELGVQPGDRVTLVSENRPEWLIADLGIMAAGAITVPTYTTNTERDHLHILENSGAKGAVVSTQQLARAFLPAAHQSDPLQFVITLCDPNITQQISADIHLWADVLARSDATVDEISGATAGFQRTDTACIIYTSGTGGAPKGVMLHHGAILHNCASAIDVLTEIGVDDNVFLSFLPLSHAYEHSAGQFLPIATGAQIYYAEGIDKLAANMEEARPTIMVVVPRLFELMRSRITRAIEKEGGLRARLFDKALTLGKKRFEAPETLTFIERIQNFLLDWLVRRKVRKRFGGRLRALVSGGAPLNPEVGDFFAALGLPLMQGYGQTEAGPVISVNRPSAPKMHTVGPPLKGTGIRIAEDGEILVHGELVMQGYWRDQTATDEALQDGWLHTGDIGHIDQDGHLEITDRKKDIIVSDKGENISPQRVEGMLALQPEIAQVMVYGDQRPYLVGLVVPDAEWLAEWAEAHGKPDGLAELADDAELAQALDDAVSRVNRRLSNVEKVRRFAVAREAFTIENEQMTPTMKVRRHVISAAYREAIEGLYG